MTDTNFNFGYNEEGFIDLEFIEVSSGDSNYNFEFGTSVFIYQVLFGSSNNFNSLWVDEKSSLQNNRLYIGRPNDLTIIKTKDNQVVIEDYYSKTVPGRTEETLIADDSVDINVTY
jgi:hypothetical protein